MSQENQAEAAVPETFKLRKLTHRRINELTGQNVGVVYLRLDDVLEILEIALPREDKEVEWRWAPLLESLRAMHRQQDSGARDV